MSKQMWLKANVKAIMQAFAVHTFRAGAQSSTGFWKEMAPFSLNWTLETHSFPWIFSLILRILGRGEEACGSKGQGGSAEIKCSGSSYIVFGAQYKVNWHSVFKWGKKSLFFFFCGLCFNCHGAFYFLFNVMFLEHRDASQGPGAAPDSSTYLTLGLCQDRGSASQEPQGERVGMPGGGQQDGMCAGTLSPGSGSMDPSNFT